MTLCIAWGKLRPVSAEAGPDPRMKHRHDIGEPDHGPEFGEAITRNIQVLLGLFIAGSALLLLYAFIVKTPALQ